MLRRGCACEEGASTACGAGLGLGLGSRVPVAAWEAASAGREPAGAAWRAACEAVSAGCEPALPAACAAAPDGLGVSCAACSLLSAASVE